MDNLAIYNQVREVPAGAQKDIAAGRLKGMTDINPMWRIKKLTEVFGPCGIGWKYDIIRQWTEPGADGNICAFCNISLSYKQDGEWSAGIPGTGGSTLVSKESKGLYTDDECYKKALTDAISVSAKALGVGADIYWQKDSSKYDKPQETEQKDKPLICPSCKKPIKDYTENGKIRLTAAQVAARNQKKWGLPICADCAMIQAAENGN